MCECVYQCLMPMSCTGLAVQSGFCIYNAARMNQCKSADRPCCQYYSGDRCVPYVNNSNTVVSLKVLTTKEAKVGSEATESLTI